MEGWKGGRVEETNSRTHEKSRPGVIGVLFRILYQDLLLYSCKCLVHRSGFANPDRAVKGRAELYSTPLEVAFFKSHEMEREFCRW